MKINDIITEYNTRQSLRSLRSGFKIDPINQSSDDDTPYSAELHGINKVKKILKIKV
jgi:hypothetical protein